MERIPVRSDFWIFMIHFVIHASNVKTSYSLAFPHFRAGKTSTNQQENQHFRPWRFLTASVCSRKDLFRHVDCLAGEMAFIHEPQFLGHAADRQGGIPRQLETVADKIALLLLLREESGKTVDFLNVSIRAHKRLCFCLNWHGRKFLSFLNAAYYTTFRVPRNGRMGKSVKKCLLLFRIWRGQALDDALGEPFRDLAVAGDCIHRARNHVAGICRFSLSFQPSGGGAKGLPRDLAIVSHVATSTSPSTPSKSRP